MRWSPLDGSGNTRSKTTFENTSESMTQRWPKKEEGARERKIVAVDADEEDLAGDALDPDLGIDDALGERLIGMALEIVQGSISEGCLQGLEVPQGHVVRRAHETRQRVVDALPSNETRIVEQQAHLQGGVELSPREHRTGYARRDQLEFGATEPDHAAEVRLEGGISHVVPARLELRPVDHSVRPEQGRQRGEVGEVGQGFADESIRLGGRRPRDWRDHGGTWIARRLQEPARDGQKQVHVLARCGQAGIPGRCQARMHAGQQLLHHRDQLGLDPDEDSVVRLVSWREWGAIRRQVCQPDQPRRRRSLLAVSPTGHPAQDARAATEMSGAGVVAVRAAGSHLPAEGAVEMREGRDHQQEGHHPPGESNVHGVRAGGRRVDGQ